MLNESKNTAQSLACKTNHPRTELFPFQTVGAEWLSKRRFALLADEMGLGKSAQAIHAADLVGAENILVVCPSVARVNWEREFEKFSTKNRQFHVLRGQSEKLPYQHSAIISYDLLATNIHGVGSHYDTLILDEVHFLKSLDTRRTKAVFGARDGIVHKAKRVWALSATPAPNDVSEIWLLLYSFGATKLKYDDFVERYCETIQTNFGPKVVGNKSAMLPELRTIIARVSIRRFKKDVLKELPPIFFSTSYVDAGEVPINRFAADALLKAREQEAECSAAFGVIDSLTNAEQLLMLEGLAQSVSTLRRYNGLKKVLPAVELIKSELEAGAYSKLVIFAIHTDVIVWLMEELKKYRPVAVYGAISNEKRQEAIDDFQNNLLSKIIILNIHAGGTAITLTAAHNVLFIEKDWVPGNNAQAAMRCHRIGQTRIVNVRALAIADGIDARINQLLERKEKNLIAAGL